MVIVNSASVNMDMQVSMLLFRVFWMYPIVVELSHRKVLGLGD